MRKNCEVKELHVHSNNTKTSSGSGSLLLPCLGTEQLSSDLGSDLGMEVLPHYETEGFLGIALELIFISLDEYQQALMPQNWKLPIIVDEYGKVLHQTRNHRSWERIFLVEQCLDKD